MAPAVQEARSKRVEDTSMPAYPVRGNLSSGWIFTRYRSLGPIVIGGLLVVFYFVSPHLPQAFRDFLATLR